MKSIKQYINESKHDYEIALEFNGQRYTDKGVCKIIDKEFKEEYKDAKTFVHKLVDYIIDKFKNTNNINVFNAVLHYMYYYIEIHNKNIENYIEDYIQSKVDDGKLTEW